MQAAEPGKDVKARDPAHERGLVALVDMIDRETGDGHVTVGDIIDLLGSRSLIPLLLLPCLAMVSPLSAVPGVPSLLSAIVGLVAVQLLLGRSPLWLPRVLLKRSLHADRISLMVRRLRPGLAWLDGVLCERAAFLTQRPANLPALCVFCVVSFFMPAIEFVPFLTTTLASAMTLFAVALFTRDGLLMLAGYALVGLGAALIVQTVNALG